MHQDCQRLLSITGIGPQTSALLTELLSRLHFANSDALAADNGGPSCQRTLAQSMEDGA